MLLLKVLFRYAQLKIEIPESRYNNGVEKFLKANSLLQSEIPVELIKLVKGREIWLTVRFLFAWYTFLWIYSVFKFQRRKSIIKQKNIEARKNY